MKDFLPWVDPDEAGTEGASCASSSPSRWLLGGEDGTGAGRWIKRFLHAADLVIYTPGSSAGLPLMVSSIIRRAAPALIGVYGGLSRTRWLGGRGCWPSWV